jgi:hypothetical protein
MRVERRYSILIQAKRYLSSNPKSPPVAPNPDPRSMVGIRIPLFFSSAFRTDIVLCIACFAFSDSSSNC